MQEKKKIGMAEKGVIINDGKLMGEVQQYEDNNAIVTLVSEVTMLAFLFCLL